MKTGLKYGAALIGTYLVVYYYTGSTSFANAGFGGLQGLVASLQGRVPNQQSQPNG